MIITLHVPVGASLILRTVATKLSQLLIVPSLRTICIVEVQYKLADGVSVNVQSGKDHHLVIRDPEISVGFELDKIIHVALEQGIVLSKSSTLNVTDHELSSLIGRFVALFIAIVGTSLTQFWSIPSFNSVAHG